MNIGVTRAEVPKLAAATAKAGERLML